MRLVPEIAWRTAGAEPVRLDPRLLPLLREIRLRATLRAATAAVGLSYRGAWDLLGAQARALGAPLVVLRRGRGRGATLSPLAERLVAADDAARAEIEKARERLAVPVDAASRSGRLRLCASHDLLLADFLAAAGLAIDLSFRGSMESVAAFSRGEADFAGFHVLGGAGWKSAAAPVLKLVKPKRDCLIRFAEREQGLMAPAGNPKTLRSLEDVAAKRLRFVNRQRGSGTRALTDRLLDESGIAAAALRGYADEEFTHAAVAATIAAGRADAGVGVRAAAKRFRLAFVPLRRERYWLASRRDALAEPLVERFLAALRGPALPRIARRLTGYDAAGAGEVVPVSVLEGDDF